MNFKLTHYPLAGKVVGSIPLGGKPEFAQADGDGHIYVNVEDKSQLSPSIRRP